MFLIAIPGVSAETPLALVALSSLLAVIGMWWCRRGLRARLRRADGRLCVYCRYTLKDLPSPGICPECGNAFPIDGHASRWEHIRE
jgi:hypothetical protein